MDDTQAWITAISVAVIAVTSVVAYFDTARWHRRPRP